MARILGTDGSDVLNGTSGNDTLIGDPHVAGQVELLQTGVRSHVLTAQGNRIVYTTSTGVYAKDLATGVVTQVNTDGSGTVLGKLFNLEAVSADGTLVCMTRIELVQVVPGRPPEPRPVAVFVKNTITGTLTEVPLSNIYHSFSDDNSKLFLTSFLPVTPDDTNGARDSFALDLASGASTRLSTDSNGVQLAQGGGLSDSATNGTVIVLQAEDTALAGDTNQATDVFVKNTLTGQLQLVSTSSTGVLGNGNSYSGAVTSDGQYVVFRSQATNLATGDTNALVDAYVKNLVTGELRLLSSNASGQSLGSSVLDVQLSEDGSKAMLWVAPNGADRHIYVKDLATGALTRVAPTANNMLLNATLTADGRYVVFESDATNLTSSDTNGLRDVLVYEVATGAVRLLSVNPDGSQFALNTSGLVVSGNTVAFIVAGSSYVVNLNEPGSDADVFNGGSGVDTVSYETALTGVTVNLLDPSGNSNTGDALGDTYNSIEQFKLSKFNDTFIGASATSAVNIAYGGAGDDLFKARGTSTNTFYGEDGNDTFKAADGVIAAYGGAGNDTFNGWSMIDTFHGGNGDDIAYGGGNHDILNGNDGNDYINGEKSDDIINGGAGDDTLVGLWDQDKVYGGTGNDTLTGDHGNDMLAGQDGNDSLDGGIGTDKLYGGNGEDTLVGGDQNDLLYGGNGNDSLVGGNDADTLNGGAGLDVLRGGIGNDRLTGGTGADTFRFGETTFGRDTITDFEDGVDRISMTTALADSFSDLTITGNGTTTVTVAVGGQSIVMHGASAVTLTSGDFIFG